VLGCLVATVTRARYGPVRLRFLRDVDECFSVGGGFLQIRSLREALSVSLVHVSQLLIARRLGVPLVMLPQSVGPFTSRAGRAFARRFLGWFDTLLVREDLSIEHLRSVDPALARRSQRAPDLAMWSSPPSNVRKSDSRKTVGIVARQWWFPGNADPVRAYVRYLDELAKTIDGLADRGYEVELLIQCDGPTDRADDRVAARDVAARVGVPPRMIELDPALPATRLLDRYAEYDLLVATRLHAALLGLIASVPSIAIGYEDKTAGILDQLGLAEWRLDIGDVSAERLLRLVDDVDSFPTTSVVQRIAALRLRLREVASSLSAT
jgi:colanic acid/amylovoran biosynthesis protein